MIDISHGIAFVLGTMTGAAGHYFGVKYTEKRHLLEHKANFKKTFLELNNKMPKLFKEMKEDLIKDESGLIMEFVLLPNDRVSFSGSKKRFYYFMEQHSNLQNAIDLLLDHEFIIDISNGKVPIYRMDKEFIDHLKAL